MDVFRAHGVLCAHKTQTPNEVFVCVGRPRANSPDLDVLMSRISIIFLSMYMLKNHCYRFRDVE